VLSGSFSSTVPVSGFEYGKAFAQIVRVRILYREGDDCAGVARTLQRTGLRSGDVAMWHRKTEPGYGVSGSMTTRESDSAPAPEREIRSVDP